MKEVEDVRERGTDEFYESSYESGRCPCGGAGSEGGFDDVVIPWPGWYLGLMLDPFGLRWYREGSRSSATFTIHCSQCTVHSASCFNM